mgnify:CR=1 FL=1
MPQRQIKPLSPSYLQKHNLWDSYWLEEKYPEFFMQDVTCSQCNYVFKGNISNKNLCCTECLNTWSEYGFH